MLTSGNADFITNLAASDYAGIEGDANLQLLVDNNPTVFYVGLQQPPRCSTTRRCGRRSPWASIGRGSSTFYLEGRRPHRLRCSISENGCEGASFPDALDPEAARALLVEAGILTG